MPGRVRVRSASASDVEAICSFGAAHIPAHYRSLIGEEAARTQVERWWSRDRISAAVGDRRVVVAESPSGLLGVAEWGAWDGAPVLWKLYVHPDHRGRGLGQHLLRAVIARLPTGSRRLQVEHFAANERAGRFYEREGFEWVRTEPNPADPATAVIWRELDLVSRSPRSSDRSTSSVRR